MGTTFSALLTASFVTNLGDGIRLAALPLLATTLTSSPFLIASVTAAQFLPWMTFAPFGGVIVDRADRRRLIMVTQAGRALVMVLLVVAVLVDAAHIGLLLVVAYLITAGEILVDPSVVATIPTLVAPADLDRANSRLTTVEVTTNEFIGAPVGALTFGLAPWLPFLLDSLSYAGSIAPFSRVRPTRDLRAERPRRSVRDEMGDGVRWIVGHPFLRRLTIGVAVFHLGTAGALSVLILVVTDLLHAPRITFGIVLAASALGSTGASLVAARLTSRFSRRIVITVAATLSALTVAAVGGIQAEWQLIALWIVNGFSSGILVSIGRGFIQRHTPNDRLGRTAVASRMITRTSFVIGALLAGVVAATTSVRWSFVVAGGFHLLGTALLCQSFRHEPDEVDQQH